MPERFILVLQALLASVLLFCAAAFVVVSWRWPLVGDAALMHYVVFLMRQGWAPYREIVDLNLPGTYAAEALAMAALGPGALGWRVYDLGLLAAIGLEMGAICGRRSWFAAVWAGCVFALVHGRDGLIDTGQRDLLMAVLVLGGCCVLVCVRRLWGRWLFGLLLGAAVTVKPIAGVLLPVWLGLLVFHLRAQERPWRASVGAALVGAAVPVTAMVVALTRWRAWGAFWEVMLRLIPLHASMFRLGVGALLLGSVSSVLLGVFLPGLIVFIAMRRRRGFRAHILLAGLGFGVLSFVLQGRGYPYHRYPSEAFLLLLAGLAFEEGLRSQRKFVIALSLAELVFGSLVVAPRSLALISHYDWRHDEYGTMLGRDLEELGGAKLTGKVQCLDQAGGCVDALYRTRLVQSTGFLYDCYLFVKPVSVRGEIAQAQYRQAFMAALRRNQPTYLIVMSDECGLRDPDFAYAKLAYWPQLQQMVRSEYVPIRDRTPKNKIAWGGVPVLPYGFRIYKASDR